MATTIEGFREMVRRFRDVEKSMKRVVLLSARRARKDARKQLVKTPLAKALKRKKSIPIELTRVKAKRSEDGGGLEAGFEAKGMTAHIDLGISTDPHEIEAKGDALVFPGSGAFEGQIVRTQSVNHPGSITKRADVIEPTFDLEAPRYESDIAEALENHAGASFR